MEELRKALKSLGLSEQETEIYIKLLYLKQSTASNIGKQLKMHRRGVYDITERLLKKGILTSVEKDGKKYFMPIDPQQILDILAEKEREFREGQEILSEIMPRLGQMTSGEDAGAEMLFGKEGIKALYMDELREGKTIHIICTSIDRTEEILGNFLVSYTRDRIRKKIPIKAIVARGAKTDMEKYGLMEVRYLPADQISPASMSVYGNKLAITLWSGAPITILVKSREIAESFRNHFEMIWKTSKK